jgi:uncharacterized damage-inducible protein DinB
MQIIGKFFMNQIKAEADITRKFLEIIPEDRYDWQPHHKSMTIRRLATHIAELPGWIPMAISTDVLDFSVGNYTATPIANNKQLSEVFENNQRKAEDALAAVSDEFLQNSWTMKNGDQVYFTITKEEVIRMSMSQTIHHRAQLGVFLRLLDIPIPGSYGPSADESF